MPRSSIFYAFVLFMLGFFFYKPTPGVAQQFVYQPINPAFGGSPLNYQWLLSSASTQNKFRVVQDFGLNDDPMANFQQNLQRQILSELTQQIVRSKFGEDFNLNESNTLNFGDFSIDVVPDGSGVSVRIFNVATGQETSVTIPNVN